MDYALPRADDLPPLEVTLAGVPTARNPLGVKGSGQAGCIGAPQTIVHAILDALAPLGIDHIDMPATPERIWRAIRDSRKSPSPAATRLEPLSPPSRRIRPAARRAPCRDRAGSPRSSARSRR